MADQRVSILDGLELALDDQQPRLRYSVRRLNKHTPRYYVISPLNLTHRRSMISSTVIGCHQPVTGQMGAFIQAKLDAGMPAFVGCPCAADCMLGSWLCSGTVWRVQLAQTRSESPQCPAIWAAFQR